jgi:hypothetical protein
MYLAALATMSKLPFRSARDTLAAVLLRFAFVRFPSAGDYGRQRLYLGFRVIAMR